MGIAPTAKINVQRISSTSGFANTYGGQLTWANDAYANGCAVQTHSHNEYNSPDGAVAGAYNATAQLYDFSVRDTYEGDSVDTPMPVIVSAGNIRGGSYYWYDEFADKTKEVLSPATAKNVISVGAAESYRPGISACTTGTRQPGDFYAEGFNNVAYVSRRGTWDGRIKPDILAPATMMSSTHTRYPGVAVSCRKDSTGLYNIDSGTSYAAPQVAGGVVLINAKGNATYTPAMLKATLVGTAKSMAGGIDRYQHLETSNVVFVASRPNPVQGFGRMFLADFLLGTQPSRMLDETSFVPFTASGQTRSGSFTVSDVNKPVVLVLAWSDEPGSLAAGPALVRNLDIDVRNGCTRYAGNKMNSQEYSIAQSSCSGTVSYDNLNNVEMIIIPPNTLTTISYVITAKSWGFGSHNQKFALFVANVL
jgi:subtilisin family serine protease